jgi:elongation factor G
LVINRLDRDRASFERALDSIQQAFGRAAIPIQLPLGEEKDFRGIIDLLQMKAFVWAGDEKGTFKQEEIPAELKDQADTARTALVEMVAEGDDALMEKFFEAGELTEEELLTGLKNEIREGRIFPISTVSATHNIGVQRLLDNIVDLTPSPADRGPATGKDPSSEEKSERKVSEDEPASAFVFKTIADPYAGRITMFRVMSGALKSDSPYHNVDKDMTERVGALSLLQGKNTTPVSEVKAGDLAAVAKLKETQTGDTLCNKNSPIVYEKLEFPAPVISFAIEPKSRGDEEKISLAMQRLAEEDVMLAYHRDASSNELILSGTGQLHIEVVVGRLKRKFGVEVDLHPPKVPGGSIPRQYIPAVEKGIQEARMKGFLAGCQVVDFKVSVYDGKHHDVDSSELAFKIAGSMAFKEAMQQCRPILLEPIMNVEISVPDETTGDVLGDLNSRRGRTQGMEKKGTQTAIKAQVPMAEMLSYEPVLTSMTGGRGAFHMEYSHYEQVPAQVQQKIIEDYRRAKEEEK